MYLGTKMFIKNNKPVKIIGFPESSMTQEYFEVFTKYGLTNISIITPDQFISIKKKEEFQYIIGMWFDMKLRRKMCDMLDDLDLDCVTYISDSVYIFDSSKVGKGCFINHQCTVCWNTSIGNHCYFGIRSAIGHDTNLGMNNLLFSGAWIAGKVNTGENCKFNFNSSVINNVDITDNVTLGAFSNLSKDAMKPGTYLGRIAKLMKSEPTDKDP